MAYALLSSLCSVSISIALKVAGRRRVPTLQLLFWNYAVAVAIVGVVGALSHRFVFDAVSLGVGVCTGAVFIISFWVYIWGIGRFGIAIMGSLMSLGLVVPVSASIAVWGERPPLVVWLGFVFVVAAIVLLGLATRDEKRVLSLGATLVIAPALVLLFGLGGLGIKAFEQLGGADHKDFFFTILFGTALALAGTALAARRERLGRPGAAWGLGVGAPNLGASYFFVMALAILPASLVFPFVSATALTLTAVAGAAVFGERLGATGWTAIALAAGAVVLLNLA
jgi:drug/metabolite transporter (DMT)-like permease